MPAARRRDKVSDDDWSVSLVLVRRSKICPHFSELRASASGLGDPEYLAFGVEAARSTFGVPTPQFES